MKAKILAAIVAMLITSAVFIPMVMAGKPAAWDETQDSAATVSNTAPIIGEGWVEIWDDVGELAYTTDPTAPVQGYRDDPYIWESEKIKAFVWIHDDNGLSDLLQHTCQAWWSPENAFITDMQLDRDTVNPDETEGIYHGEYIVPGPGILQCAHDVYVTDTDKYGATGRTVDGDIKGVVADLVFLNPFMSSTFEPTPINWLDLHAGDMDVAADTNTHNLHVAAMCTDSDGNPIPVAVRYELEIKGTDLEGGVSNAETIPCENVKVDSARCGLNHLALTNADVLIATDLYACEDVDFDFYLDVPWIEPADYHGQVDFDIRAT